MIRHISCRVPWHDNGWNGTICKNPEKNQSCRRCKAIHEDINIDLEVENSGAQLCGLECKNDIPCIREGAAFLCEKELSVSVSHPYSHGNGWKYFSSLKDTEEDLPKYSYPFVPFRWLRKTFNEEDKNYLIDKTKRYGIDYKKKLEDEVENNVPKNNRLNWVNNGKNQKIIFDALTENIVPNRSLMFFYSKQVPFIEKNNRVLIGIGHVLKINKVKEYDRKDNSGIESAYLWETMMEHSVRPNSCEDGFTFPFDKILKKQKEDIKFDINKAVVLIDDDYFDEFSYKGEILSCDAVIDTLNKIKQVLEYNKENAIEFDYSGACKWINNELEKAWKERGEFPGLGNLLCAYGVEGGIKIADNIKEKLLDSKTFWKDIDEIFSDINKIDLTKTQKKSLEDFIYNDWDTIYKNKDNLRIFDLLARVSLSYKQMNSIVKRINDNVSLIPKIIDNPYLVFELTMDLDDIDNNKIRLKQLDYAFCAPDTCTFEPKNIINDKLIVKGSRDKRRLRAYILDLLTKEAKNGNTVYPFKYVINKINDLRLDVECVLSEKAILDNKDFYEESHKCVVISSDENNDENYFKLLKYVDIDNIIKDFVLTNIKKKNKIEINWEKEYDEFIRVNKYEINDDWKKEDIDALKKLSINKFSILTGGAGTGKTSILSILCNEISINNGGVLLLAPTGKAAVRMHQSIKLESMTLASFLIKPELYKDGNYFVASSNEQNSFNRYSTIVIDESSMLTEDMVGALLSYIDKNVDRVIFVGDYSQLPPIGAGRPFFDIINYLRENGYNDNVIELYNNKRQVGDNRLDVDFANCFKYENSDAKEYLDSYLELIKENANDKINFTPADEIDFDEKLKENMMKATNVKAETVQKDERYMKNVDDIEGFNRSLGKEINDKWFNHKNDYFKNIGCAIFADNWQIITPIKGKNIGVQNINSLIQKKYKTEKFYQVPKMGPDNISYGEKVIQLKNKKRSYFDCGWKSDIIMNGELGITCNIKASEKFKNLQVEFVGRNGKTYIYSYSDLEKEGEPLLQLAYALTIHKCQGSQFKNVVAVLKNECGMLSKELIYTALTRHEDHLYIVGDDDLDFLKNYTSNTYSELAKRFTGLFQLPDLIQYEDTYYQKGLIHVGDGGRLLRSKSEVIIWNKLYALNDKFTTVYEERFAKGKTLPDFVIKDKNGEIKFIWEHLGFTKDKNYMKRWQEKEQIYNENGFSIEKGNLIITKDVNQAIDSEDINNKINYIVNNI